MVWRHRRRWDLIDQPTNNLSLAMTRNRRGDDSKNLNRRDRFQTCPYQPNHHHPITTTPEHQQKSATKPRRPIKHTHQPVGAVREPPYQPNHQPRHHRRNTLINHPYLSIDATPTNQPVGAVREPPCQPNNQSQPIIQIT